MKFTQEILNKITDTDTLTKKQFEVIGESWPPLTGWKNRNFGKEIT
jgi:hypothetical protein